MSARTAMPAATSSTPSPNPAASSAAVAGGTCPCQSALSPRDEQRLATLEPECREKVRLVLRLMAIAGHRMFVTSARRSTTEQAALYAQGRTVPGPIVTHLDGVARRSKHQDGVAVDCAFVGEDPWAGPWEMYGKFGEAVGLTWGGSWKKFKDRPHLEKKA